MSQPALLNFPDDFDKKLKQKAINAATALNKSSGTTMDLEYVGGATSGCRAGGQ